MIDYINFCIGTAALTISTLGLLQVLISRHFEKTVKAFFILFFSLMVGCAFFSVTDQYLSMYRGPIYARLARITLFWESLLPAVVILLLTAFLLYSCGEPDWRRSRVFHVTAVTGAVYCGLLIYTQFSTQIYSIDENNIYQRGPYYPLLLVPAIFIMVVNVIVLWKRRNSLSPKQRIAFWVYTVVPTVSMLIQMRFYGIYTILLGSSIAVFFMFIMISMDQTEHYYRQLQENSRMRTEILLSQIQPHFLYNTLGAIQSLCKTDPPTAEKAVAKFSRYLRGNMNALNQEEPIPFTQELAHTRLYLELEQLRYEDALQVCYDLGCTEFQIPTLTLQPLAENAVRHGVRGKLSGRGTVTISTREFPGCYKIVVTDDGPGLDPQQEHSDGKTHIGLENVKERLRFTVNGQLDIDSVPGKGTSATITLPKKST